MLIDKDFIVRLLPCLLLVLILKQIIGQVALQIVGVSKECLLIWLLGLVVEAVGQEVLLVGLVVRHGVILLIRMLQMWT